jgi:glycosyltransferase involved in cell wall biosynthesis
VIPCFNSGNWIYLCLHGLDQSLGFANMSAHVVIIDDASSEAIQIESKPYRHLTIEIIRNSQNLGRLQSRLVGLRHVKHTTVMLLDSRVLIQKDFFDSLKNHYPKVENQCVIASIDFPSNSNLIGVFWYAIAILFWREQIEQKDAFLISIDNFSKSPLGTTCLVGDRESLVDAFTPFEFNNPRYLNDDTRIFRTMINKTTVIVDPRLKAIYYPRQKLLPFLKHSFHRGRMLFDGRRNLSLLLLILFGILLVPLTSFHLFNVFAVYLCFYLIVCLLIIFAFRRSLSTKLKISLCCITPLFMPFYIAGNLRAAIFATWNKTLQVLL